jgi:hypothetical protein
MQHVAKGQAQTRASHNILGRIERGLDFLDYHFSPAGLTVAAKSIGNFIEKASRLYAQKRNAGQPARHPIRIQVELAHITRRHCRTGRASVPH